MTWTVYILECVDGTYYTGIAADLKRRINEHQRGVGARYTKGRAPVRLMYQEIYSNRSDATKREIKIKHLKKEKKRLLITSQSERIASV